MALKQLFTFGFSILITSALFAQQKAEVRIQKEVDGKVQEVTKEIEIQEGQDISELLRSLDLLDEMGELKPGEKFEIILRKSNDADILSEQGVYVAPSPPKLFADDDRGFLGVVLLEVDPEWAGDITGAEVTEVKEGTAAQDAGIEVGDILLEVNVTPIENTTSAVKLIGAHNAGESITLKILRNGEEFDMDVVLGERERDDFWPGAHSFTPFPHRGELDNDFWGHIDLEPKAFLGITKGEETEEGVEVGSVVEASSAEEMGLQEGDIILEIDKQTVGSFNELADMIASKEPGDAIELRIRRDGKKKTIKGNVGQNDVSTGAPDYKRFRGCEEDGSYLFEFEMPEFEERLEGLFDDLEERFSEEQLEELMERLEDSGRRAQELFEDRFNDRYDETTISIEVLPLDDNEMEDIARQLDLDNEDLQGLEIDKIELYPNPTNANLRFSMLLNTTGPVQLMVLDSFGNEIFAESFDHAGGRIVRSIDLSREANGSYFLVISQQDKIFTKKIIKQ